MKHAFTHDLEVELARKTAKKALEEYAVDFADYGPRVNWVSSDRADVRFSAKGLTISGSLAVEPRAFVLDLSVPFLLKPFERKAASVLEDEISKWVGKAKAGDV